MEAGFQLDGRLALVTGGASGIGAGIAESLAQAGALVVVADIDQAGAQNQVERLNAAGYRADWVALDLANEASIVQACAQVVELHGTPWALVNNAGLQSRELLLEASADHWQRTHAVNARGPMLMIREIGQAMVAGGNGGRIVNVASAVLIGQLIHGLAAYTASKGALLGLSRSAALELAPHAITVNTLLPGGVMTPGSLAAAKGPEAAGPARRLPVLGFCEPSDMGAAVQFFVSPAARYVTNQVLAVDAGWTLT